MLRDILGRLIAGVAPIVWWVGGVWGLVATFGWLSDKIGTLFSLLALFVLPISLPIVALIAGFADGNWSIAGIGFGALVIATVFGTVGGMILGDRR